MTVVGNTEAIHTLSNHWEVDNSDGFNIEVFWLQWYPILSSFDCSWVFSLVAHIIDFALLWSLFSWIFGIHFRKWFVLLCFERRTSVYFTLLPLFILFLKALLDGRDIFEKVLLLQSNAVIDYPIFPLSNLLQMVTQLAFLFPEMVEQRYLRISCSLEQFSPERRVQAGVYLKKDIFLGKR